MKLSATSVLQIIAHLIAMAVFGGLVLGLSVALVSAGIPFTFLLGFGLLLLALWAYLLAGAVRVDRRRVEGLFDITLPAQPIVRSPRTDWLRWLHTAWLQVKDARNWIGVLHIGIIAILGGATIGLLGLVFHSIPILVGGIRFPGREFLIRTWFEPVSGGGAILAATLTILISLAAIVALAYAHRAVTRNLLVPSREEELAQQVTAVSHSRREAVNAADIERTRIERDLHDGVQPRLVSVGMTLGMAKNKLATDPGAAAALIEEAHTSTKAAITELRQLARGIHPAVLDDRGLDAALSALAARSHVPVMLDVRLTRRYPKEIEAALYFTIAETLTNAAKHSAADQVRVTVLEREGSRIWARIEDDGVGGAVRSPGGGIDGVAGRVAAVGGTFSLTSPEHGPTTIEVSVPCES